MSEHGSFGAPEHHGHRPMVRELRHDPDDRPFMVIWETTRACQLACAHCRADAQYRFHPDQLTTEQGKALLDDLAEFGKPTPIVVLTGGDPFERPDLEELVAHGTERGLSMAISPSVTANFTDERIGSLRAAGAKAISLSLDGARAETHDSFRGFPGTFESTLWAAGIANKHQLRLQVNSAVARRTVRELPDLMVLVKERMNAHLWSLFFLVPTGRGQALEALSAEEVEDVLHWFAEVSGYMAMKTTEGQAYRRVVMQRAALREAGEPMPQRGELYDFLIGRTRELLGDTDLSNRRPRPPLATNSGRGFCFVDHVGDVYPSGFLPFPQGSVKERSFRDIYRTAPVMLALRRPDEFHGKCGVCEFNAVCGGSRSHAFAVTGDHLASDPTCVYVPPRWDPATMGDPITGRGTSLQAALAGADGVAAPVTESGRAASEVAPG